MPLTKKELPLEVGDHVTLDHNLVIGSAANDISLVVLGGTHGMVKQTYGLSVLVEFGGHLFCFGVPQHNLSLYRRSQNSKRRKS